MRFSTKTTAASAFAALAILAASAVPASPAPIAAAKPNFNGTWSVLWANPLILLALARETESPRLETHETKPTFAGYRRQLACR